MKAVGIPLQYACFQCRKSFKRRPFSASISRFMTAEQAKEQSEEVQKFEEQREYKCLDCGGECSFMGQDLKAPKKTDLKAWKNVEAFISSGKVFYRGSQT